MYEIKNKCDTSLFRADTCLSGGEDDLLGKAMGFNAKAELDKIGLVRRTLSTSYKNSLGEEIYVYTVCDGKDVWTEERLKQL